MQRPKDNGPIAKIIFFIINEDIQNELDITRPQLRSIKEGFDKLREESMSKIKEVQKIPDSEKPKLMPALMREITDSAVGFLSKALRPEQFKRFQQLRLQYEGLRSSLNEAVSRELSLTTEQINSIKDKAALHKTPIARVPEPVMKEIMDLLSEEQATKWQEMFGAPFDFGETEPQAPSTPPGGLQRPQPSSAPAQSSAKSNKAPGAPAGDPFADESIF